MSPKNSQGKVFSIASNSIAQMRENKKINVWPQQKTSRKPQDTLKLGTPGTEKRILF